jgi:uncharacterized protein
MEMRDGTLLRADIFRLDDKEKHAAILIRTPYDKLRSTTTDHLNPLDAAFAGFAVATQDVRGRYASDGQYGGGDMFAIEGADGYDSIEWIAAQPWCDGNVGMSGLSYQAFLQWITALQNPPHLKAIAPSMYGAGPVGEQSLLGGVMVLHLDAHWTPLMAVDVANKLEKLGQDVSRMRMMIMDAMLDNEKVYNFLPLKDVPHFKFPGVEQIWKNKMANTIPAPELEWKARWPYEKVNVPCLYIEGWYDLHTWAIFENWKRMKEKGGSEVARDGQHILVGPWAHGEKLPGYLGEVNFGTLGGRGALVSDYSISFFKKYLCGTNVKLPGVRYFVMGKNRWGEADTWPPQQVSWQRFFLHSQGHANTSAGDGNLSREQPGAGNTDKYIYDPHNPVPTMGGRVVPQTGHAAGPIDQSRIHKRQDVLCYSGPELTEDTEVTGPIEAHLFAATSARDTDFVCRLIDVYPDGRAYSVAEGVIRARYRQSIFKPQLMTPGEVNEYKINMGNTSHLFKKGHRMLMDVASSNFPAFDRNMNTGNALGEDAVGVSATQTIYHGLGQLSYIDLPLVGTNQQ